MNFLDNDNVVREPNIDEIRKYCCNEQFDTDIFEKEILESTKSILLSEKQENSTYTSASMEQPFNLESFHEMMNIMTNLLFDVPDVVSNMWLSRNLYEEFYKKVEKKSYNEKVDFLPNLDGIMYYSGPLEKYRVVNLETTEGMKAHLFFKSGKYIFIDFDEDKYYEVPAHVLKKYKVPFQDHIYKVEKGK